MFQNGASAKPFLRFALVIFSLLGIVSTSLLTGVEINPDSITSLATIGLETALSAGISHVVYATIAAFRRAD